jgi:hypothetical protein
MGVNWRVHVRCLDDGREGMKRKRECGYRKHLDIETLVATRGRAFPLARLAQCLLCPRCGCRDVAVIFDLPPVSQTNAAARPYRQQR